jgi:large subunit ribosomal protein L29e
MAKSKNHTAHNQTFKDHRNGIKKPKRQYKTSQKGMYRPFLKNQKYAKANNYKWGKKQEKLAEVKAKKTTTVTK